MRKLLVAMLGLAVIAGPGAALAQEGAQERSGRDGGRDRGSRMIERLDTDGDGAISADEWAAVARGVGPIAEADGDGDGVLTVEEILAARERLRAERQARRIERRYDIDGDGEITVEELTEHKQEQFALLDRDNDGTLSMREMRAMPWLSGEGRGGMGRSHHHGR